mgnify:CR=1 FL=1
MEFTAISDAMHPEMDGKEVSLRGWIFRKRTAGKMLFMVLRDASGIMQCAVKQDKVDAKAWEDAGKALIESSVELKGAVKKDGRAPGGYELQATGFKVTQFSEIFPISKDQSTEFLLDVRHLWLRSQKLTNIMKVRDYAQRYFREFFQKQGFWEIAPPIITKAGCEGGSTLFEVNYFGEKAFLTQSGQLYNEVFITALEKIFIFAPSFRAEPSRTPKHLAEYWHLEMEAAHYGNEENIKFQEEMVSYVCQKLAQNHPELLKFFGRDPADMLAIKAPFDRLDYADAIKYLNEHGVKKEFGDDFGAEDEKVLTGHLKKPIFITGYPKKIKAFYMKLDPKDSERVLCADMMAPEGHGELIGGSERIWELDELLQRMKEQDPPLEEKDYQWYVDMRKYGSVPHSGFGLGMERFIKWVLNLDHIRDAVPFPRVINRCYP